MAQNYRAYGRFDRVSRRIMFGDARRRSPVAAPPRPANRIPTNPSRGAVGNVNRVRVGDRPSARTYAIQRRMSGGGGYGGGGGWGGGARISQSSSGRYTRPSAPPVEAAGPVAPVKPPPPSIDAFLKGDTGYQQQLRGFAQALNDMMADITRRRGTLNTEYGVSDKALREQKTTDLKDLEADYASRGLIRSGLYGSAVGDYNREWLERFNELVRRRNEGLGTLRQEELQFKNQQKLRQQAAREEAIRRRAEQYGI